MDVPARLSSKGQLTVQLRGAIDLESVEVRLVDVVRQAVEPASAAVWIRAREPGARVDI